LSNSYGTHAGHPQPAGRSAQPGAAYDASRPKTLMVMTVASFVAVIGALGGALVTFAAGKSMLSTELQNLAPSASKQAADLLAAAAYPTLSHRAILAVVVGIILAVLAFVARGGRTGARIGLTVALLVTAAVMLLNVRDGGVPGLIRGLDGVAMIAAIAGIVATWLPANGRFASEQKAARQS
jgi:hypothetical protein